MTTSGTDTFNPNRAEVLKAALEMCGIDAYEAIEAYISESASFTLNALIKALNVNRTDVNVRERTTFETVVGDGSYSVTALGIDGMYLTSNSTDYPIQPMTEDQYNTISNKAATDRPEYFFFDRQSQTLYLSPLPDAVYTVTYGKLRQYQDMTDDDQTFDFNSSAIEMLTFGLAHRLSFKKSFNLNAGEQDRLNAQFRDSEKRYLVANSKYTKGQRSSSTMIV